MANKSIITKELKDILTESLEGDLKDLILFGSQVSFKNNDDSDFDILVILKHKPDWETEKKISDICYEIDLKYGILTDTHILGENELDLPRGKQPIFINAISNGYHI